MTVPICGAFEHNLRMRVPATDEIGRSPGRRARQTRLRGASGAAEESNAHQVQRSRRSC